MIVRDLTVRYRDSTTDTLIDYNNQRLILAPLLDFEIQIIERIAVVIEPLTGTVDDPDPNAFISVVPPSWTAGNQFAITLLSQDWEQEGFAVGDFCFVFLDWGASAEIQARIRNINANSCTFDIINKTGFVPNTTFPLRLVCLLLDESNTIAPAIHHGSGSGATSPLSALPFTTSHADAIQTFGFPTQTLPNLYYNLQKYSTKEAVIDSAFPALEPRRLREYTYRIRATQFYAYRTNLDPEAQTPTSLYNLEGRVVFSIKKRSVLRDFELTFDALLLHPNRVEDTSTFLSPGSLTVSGAGAALTPPAGFTPARQRVCLLGSDAHHALLTIADSYALTQPTTPPGYPSPRSSASFVGVMVGQSAGRWVAVMTNKVASVIDVATFEIKLPAQNIFYRYDALLGVLQKRLTAGTYTVQVLIKYDDVFYVIDEYALNTNTVVPTPYNAPVGHMYAFKTLLFPIVSEYTNKLYVTNYDLIVYVAASKSFTHILLPLPSRRTPPRIPPALTQPAGGWAGDLAAWAGGAVTLKWRVFAPDGEVYDSQEVMLPTSALALGADVINANTTITETGTQIIINRIFSAVPDTDIFRTIIRAAVFRKPEGYVPIAEKIYYIEEDFGANVLVNSFAEGHTNIDINRPLFGHLRYTIEIDKTFLAPGQYAVHVRHAVRQKGPGDATWIVIDDESYFYDFTIPAPPPAPPPSPPEPIGVCLPRTPGVLNELMPYLYRDASGGWAFSNATLTTCSLDNYCTCFELVSEIPQVYIDIIAYFRGSVQGTPVPAGAKHKARFVGRITRQDDEYTSESFVSSAYKEEDIIRTYAERYTLELLLFTSCELSHIDLMKHAEKWEVVNRSNHLLPSTIADLRPGEVSITNENDYMRVRVTLHALRWRSEYRRQG